MTEAIAGRATFARFTRARHPKATDVEIAAWWAALNGEDQKAWADTEDWHPAIREQCALLDRASEAMEVLTTERDAAREQFRETTGDRNGIVNVVRAALHVLEEGDEPDGDARQRATEILRAGLEPPDGSGHADVTPEDLAPRLHRVFWDNIPGLANGGDFTWEREEPGVREPWLAVAREALEQS